MRKLKKIIKRLRNKFLKYYMNFLCKFNSKKYKEAYPKYLRSIGINIPENYFEGGHGFIHPTVVFDGNDYSLISIGKNTTVSAEVVFLTHDYSISKGLQFIGAKESGRFLKPISVGENSFIGMRCMLLPGTAIGNNVIVGAGSVVKGKIPDNVVIAGNPAKVLCSVEEWANKHYADKDYEIV